MKLLFHLIFMGCGLFLFAQGKAQHNTALAIEAGTITASYDIEEIYSLKVRLDRNAYYSPTAIGNRTGSNMSINSEVPTSN